MPPLLQTNELTKAYGRVTALDHVSLTINQGDIYGLIGKNGAGKTTLMKTILNMVKATSGSYRYPLASDNIEYQKKIGTVIEYPALYPNCSAYENLSRYGILFNASKDEIMQTLKLVGLEGIDKRPAKGFSLGMKQRLSIAIAMLGNPEFLILDEPVNGLDPTGILDIRNLILDLNQKKNTTILISSHLLDELAKITTKFAILDHGKLVEEISAADLEKKCERKIEIHVDDPQRAVSILSQHIGEQDLHTDGQIVTVLSHLEDSAKFNKLLCDNGIMVSQLVMQSESLEQYFVRKVGA